MMMMMIMALYVCGGFSVDPKIYLCRSDKLPGEGIVVATQLKAQEVCFVSSVNRISLLGMCSLLYTYFTLPCRGLGLVGRPFIWWTDQLLSFSA